MTELNLLYVHGSALGYGRMGVELAEALIAKGVDLYDVLPQPKVEPLTEHLNRGTREKVCKNVCWLSVPSHALGWWGNQLPSIVTMWETTTLPESFRETIDAFETVIVPSEQNVELFSQYHPNVKLAYLGVNPDKWRYRERPKANRYFRFLVAGSGARKGTDLVHKAFQKVFADVPKDGPIPMLVMKNPKGEPFYGDRVEMVTGRLTDEEEIDLYASCHVYVGASRGEGFGLQPLQAIAQGMPTILTDAHGHAAFAHLGLPLSWKYGQSAYFVYGPAGDWWEPNFDELCELMEYTYKNYDKEVERSKLSSQMAIMDFPWSKTADSFVEALGGADALNEPIGQPGEWFSPDVRRYKVMLNKPWQADIAGTLYQFSPGQVYWELADIKRILFDAGLLNPSCLTGPEDGDHYGLTEAQYAKIDRYSAAHSFCYACGQTLNTQPTRVESLMGARGD